MCGILTATTGTTSVRTTERRTQSLSQDGNSLLSRSSGRGRGEGDKYPIVENYSDKPLLMLY